MSSFESGSNPNGDSEAKKAAEQAAENALAAWEICATPSAEDERAFFDTAAHITAALCSSNAGSEDAVPESLRQKLAASAHAFCDQNRAAAQSDRSAKGSGPDATVGEQHTAATDREVPAPPGRAPLFFMGTLLGVAAALVVSLVLTPEGPPGLADQREVMLASGATSIPWQPGKSLQHGKISGDVAWDGSQQKGLMRIEGLEPLPPDREYQLWIVDGDRPDSAPVDGGLFSLKGSGEQLVPIDPKIPVRNAQAFVITVEDKGGVVVSEQDVVVAIAAP